MLQEFSPKLGKTLWHTDTLSINKVDQMHINRKIFKIKKLYLHFKT